VTEHLGLDDLLAAAEAALGRSPGIRDIGILAAAMARTGASVYGEDAYPDLDAKAAALLHSIVTGHALIDGNKRLGWVAVRLFYRLNDRDLRAPIDDAFDLVAAIADGSLRDVASIAARLRAWSSELDNTGQDRGGASRDLRP
jgi:death-on-curing protein